MNDVVAVVTGASRGIGRAVAERLRDDGATVIGTSSRAGADAAPGTEMVQADVRDADATEALFASILERHGPVGVLVNNAGIQLEKPVTETSLDEWRTVMDVNLAGPFLYAKAAIGHMLTRGGGAIVNIGSTDSMIADTGLAAYTASKTAILGLTRSIAVDYAAAGIRCVCVCPTYTTTEMGEAYYDAQPDPAAARAATVVRHPQGRIATPQDIADVVAWAAGDGARFVNGQSIVVDGGALAWFGV